MANPNIIKWHRCTIDKKDLKQLSTPNDFQGFIYTFGHLTIWLIAGALSFYYFVFSVSHRHRSSHIDVDPHFQQCHHRDGLMPLYK